MGGLWFCFLKVKHLKMLSSTISKIELQNFYGIEVVYHDEGVCGFSQKNLKWNW